MSVVEAALGGLLLAALVVVVAQAHAIRKLRARLMRAWIRAAAADEQCRLERRARSHLLQRLAKSESRGDELRDVALASYLGSMLVSSGQTRPADLWADSALHDG